MYVYQGQFNEFLQEITDCIKYVKVDKVLYECTCKYIKVCHIL